MIRIRAIDHLVLRVADLDKMLRFYTEALGCDIERRQDAIGLVQLRAGEVVSRLMWKIENDVLPAPECN